MPESRKKGKFSRIWPKSQPKLKRLSLLSRKKDWSSRVSLLRSSTPSCNVKETKLLKSKRTQSANSKKTKETSSKKWTIVTNIKTVPLRTSLTSSALSSLHLKLWVVKNNLGTTPHQACDKSNSYRPKDSKHCSIIKFSEQILSNLFFTQLLTYLSIYLLFSIIDHRSPII